MSLRNRLGQAFRRVLGRPYTEPRFQPEWRPLAPGQEWPAHVLLLITLPKSGSNWLVPMLSAVPGFRERVPDDPDGCVENHDLCRRLFQNVPWRQYSVIRYHTEPTAANLAIIEEFGLRPVVLHRDLRDQSVSRYYHVLNDPAHRHHRLYRCMSPEDGLMHSIDVTCDDYIPWVEGWLQIAERRPGELLVTRYEDLHANTCGVLTAVLAFYGLELAADEIRAIVERNAAQTRFDLAANLRERRGTARKGVVGDWRNHFTADHVARFKERGGQFLLATGYENDPGWGQAHAGGVLKDSA